MQNELGNARIGLGLGIAPGLLLGVLLGFAASGFLTGSVTAPSPETLGAVPMASKMMQQAAQLQAEVHALRRSAKDLLLRADSPARLAESLRAWEARYALQTMRLDEFEQGAARKQERELARALRSELAAYDQGFTRMLRLIEAGAIPPPWAAGRAMRVVGQAGRS